MVMKCKVRKALREITGNKATGADELPTELIKAAGEAAITVLTALCQQIWESTLWLQEWSRSIFLPLPKKGDMRLCSNYRTITLIPHASKILLKIIQDRLATYSEREISEEQAEFRKGRGTRDQIANIRWILERTTEYGKTIIICFIDYSKAFDCVDHSRLWNTLRNMGVPEHLIVLFTICGQHHNISRRERRHGKTTRKAKRRRRESRLSLNLKETKIMTTGTLN
jgi:hypothetical protein